MLLSFVKVVLSWPPIALVIAILLTFTFRKAIEDFLKRLVSARIMGNEFNAPHREQQQESKGVGEDLFAKAVEAQPTVAADSVAPQHPQPPLPPELANDPQGIAAVDYARKNPIQTVIEYRRINSLYRAEWLMNRIYGTQISLLEQLADNPDAPVQMSQISWHYAKHQLIANNTSYQIKDYLGFLITSGVLAVSGPQDASLYKITQFGLEFLSYIKATFSNWNQRSF